MTSKSLADKEIPIYEEKKRPNGELTIIEYRRGRVLGKGGFATCYEISAVNENKTYAVKIIKKCTEVDAKAKNDFMRKLTDEIRIMSKLDHPNIVKYKHHFNDLDNHYIILELCSNGCLNEMLKKRKFLTEPEVRFYLIQMVEIMKYMQTMNIIHRDIKLANYFLDEKMNLKLGDFGLATINDEVFRMKRSTCGTPNYIAPEIIDHKEYGFQVDIWSMGVVVYIMLLGVPPFETKNCKDTYDKIRRCDYKLEGVNKEVKLTHEAKLLIKDILQLDPRKRLKPDQFFNHPFLTFFQIPKELDINSKSDAPSKQFLKRFNLQKNNSTKKINDSKSFSIKDNSENSLNNKKLEETSKKPTRNLKQFQMNILEKSFSSKLPEDESSKKIKSKPFLKPQRKFIEVKRQNIIIPKTTVKKEEICKIRRFETIVPIEREQRSPSYNKMTKINNAQAAGMKLREIPKLNLIASEKRKRKYLKQNQVLAYVNHQNQYGIAYILIDLTVGFLFNDHSKMILDREDKYVLHIYRENDQVHAKKIDIQDKKREQTRQEEVNKKIAILKHFLRQFRKKYTKISEVSEFDSFACKLPCHVKNYIRSESLMIFRLNTSSIHCVFNDKHELIISKTQQCILHKNPLKPDQVYYMPLTQNHTNIPQHFLEKLKQACDLLTTILRKNAQKVQEDENYVFEGLFGCKKVKRDEEPGEHRQLMQMI